MFYILVVSLYADVALYYQYFTCKGTTFWAKSKKKEQKGLVVYKKVCNFAPRNPL